MMCWGPANWLKKKKRFGSLHYIEIQDIYLGYVLCTECTIFSWKSYISSFFKWSFMHTSTTSLSVVTMVWRPAENVLWDGLNEVPGSAGLSVWRSLPGSVVGGERVGVRLQVSTEGVGAAQVPRAARAPRVVGLATFLLPRHAFQ